MLKSSLCNNSNAYVLVSGTKEITNTGTASAPNNRKNKIKNYTSFMYSRSEILHKQIILRTLT